MSKKNYYEILEIPSTASRDDVASGYSQVKLAYSPDSPAMYSLLCEDECRTMMAQIEEAYSILHDPKKREEYNLAHDIQNTYPASSSDPVSVNLRDTIVDEARTIPENPQVKDEVSINRLVAQKKFSLDYSIDEEFEKEIEQTTEFSGELLKKIREYRNVTILRLSEMTKISKTYLACIEEENIDKLPAVAYVRGFIFQYAKCLKLPPDLVATSYIYRIKKLKEE